MPGPQVRVEGLPQLKASMRKAGLDMADLKEATSRAAQVVQAASRSSAPHRSGALAGSITASKGANKAIVGSRLVYGNPIHWGWAAHNISAQPFISEAGRATEGQWLQAYEQELQQILDRVTGA
jgi:phage gpG-like protein